MKALDIAKEFWTWKPAIRLERTGLRWKLIPHPILLEMKWQNTEYDFDWLTILGVEWGPWRLGLLAVDRD